MKLHGQHLITGLKTDSNQPAFQAVNPVTGERLATDFFEGDLATVDQAVTIAAQDFDAYRACSKEVRGQLLETIADELLLLKDAIITRANLETGLPFPRLDGELTRTVNQLRMFAQFINEGDDKEISWEQAQPERQPVPKPDLRLTQVPLGPIAVFGASNFPLAFSVAGGDTVAALAAGCPVVVKGHPAHPGTSELAGRAIQCALEKNQLPAGVFSLIQGQGHAVGEAMVQHPLIKAVAFTGSQAGGRALFNLAAERPEPIPVFAEMGSVNPVFILPSKLRDASEPLAHQYAQSLTLGVGQFCTNPGLLVAIKGADLEHFLQQVNAQLNSISAMPMLHVGIKKNYLEKLQQLNALAGVRQLFGMPTEQLPHAFVAPTLLLVPAEDFLREQAAAEEVFGPSSLVVVCDNAEQLLSVADSCAGQLTATVQAQTDDLPLARQLFPLLAKKAGRLLFNDFPTGVEVCSAMHHGGPYPATTDSRFSSVGTTAIKRFLRPVCYQNVPPELLPDELKELGA